MSAVSILLNLTGRLSFEETDPLMSLVSGNGPLLFYDRLSARRFPTAKEQYDKYLGDLLSDMRNLLESRALSREDGGEQIRLIIVIDLAGGLFEPQEKGRKCFPAQKVRLFRERMKNAFGIENPLLGRICYSFIFLESTLPADGELVSFYRACAFDGLSERMDGLPPSINGERKALLEKLNPDEESSIDDPAVSERLKEFRAWVDGMVDRMAGSLDRLDVSLGEAFREMVSTRRAAVRTIGDFRDLDYDGLLQSSVRDLIGLSGKEFRQDCSFFWMKFSVSPVAVKRKDELTLTSLVLLLATLSGEDEKWLLDEPGTAAYVLGNVEDNDIDEEKLLRLRDVIRACRNKLREGGDLRKEKNGIVEYKHYEAAAHTMAESDPFTAVREKQDKERKALQAAFKKVRRVPFFFGPEPGTWRWYNETLSAAEDLYQFEQMNGRPLYDSSRRITEKEMVSSDKSCPYSGMEDEIAKISCQVPEMMPTEDIDAYYTQRRDLMQQFRNGIERLKNEMLKLGYFVNIAWISLFLSLAFGLIYAFHFFANHFKEHPLWIGAAFLVSLLCFCLGAFISHWIIKRKIVKEHLALDKCCNSMNNNMMEFLKKAKKRIEEQKKADIRRRNLAELEAIMDSFNRHNLQVDRWETFFDGLLSRIEDMLDVLKIKQGAGSDSPVKVESSSFLLDGFPTMPEELCAAFGGEVLLSCFPEKPVRGVTSFIRRFECTKIKGK